MPPWQRRLTLILCLMVVRLAGSHQEVHPQVPLNPGRKGTMGDDIPNVLQSLTSSPASSSVVQVDTLPKFLDQWTGITSNRVVLYMVMGHCLQLRCFPQY